MVLSQLPMDLSNQAIIDVTRGIYKDALATKHVQVTYTSSQSTLIEPYTNPYNLKDSECEEYECLWCDENDIACGEKFQIMSDFVNHINLCHMNDDSSEYVCMWKNCPRRNPTHHNPFKGNHYINYTI